MSPGVVFHYWIVPSSRGFSVVIVEQTTESLPPDQWAIYSVIVGRLDQRTAKALMRALRVVVSHVLADKFSQMRLTQRDDAVEAFLFDRTDEAFDESVQVGAAACLTRSRTRTVKIGSRSMMRCVFPNRNPFTASGRFRRT